MGSKLYVGNLSYNVNSSDLEQLFAQHGTVQRAEIIQDRDTGRSKGFGFVQMGSDAEAQAAIAALNGQEHDGRAPSPSMKPSRAKIAVAAAVVVAAAGWRRRWRWPRRLRWWWRRRRRPRRLRRW